MQETNNKTQKLIDDFHNLWRNRYLNNELEFMGVPVHKTPMDLWVYQEILHEIKPDIVIECGTYKGGGAWYLAHLMDILKKGKVVSIDIKKRDLPVHERITYILGSSSNPKVVKKVKEHLNGTVMVILDSDHERANVLKELEIYNEFVTKGSYMIVEDSDMNGHPARFSAWRNLPGPHEAIEEFLGKNKGFQIDKSREKFLVSICRDGYLKKV